MRTLTRLALFAVGLVAVFGLGAGLGAAVGPINVGGSSHPTHAGHEGG